MNETKIKLQDLCIFHTDTDTPQFILRQQAQVQRNISIGHSTSYTNLLRNLHNSENTDKEVVEDSRILYQEHQTIRSWLNAHDRSSSDSQVAQPLGRYSPDSHRQYFFIQENCSHQSIAY